MKARIESEVKIFGINFFIVSAAFTVAMIVLSIIAGDLLDFYPVSFEVIFPFFVTIVVGEWGKTRADSNCRTKQISFQMGIVTLHNRFRNIQFIRGF